nr:complement component C8 gamma chain [Pogona vitticeps]
MTPAVFLFICGLLLSSPGNAQRRRKKPPAPKNPIDSIGIQSNFDPNRFAGKWFLVGVASRCSYLSQNHYRLEATNVMVTVADAETPEKPLLFSIFRPLDGHCWNIRQTYFPTKTAGRFQVRGRGRNVDVVVAETDYNSYAIVYYQKAGKISAKLYGRSIKVGDAVTAKFEERMASVGLDLNQVFYFPVYGFCDSVDEYHILDETKYTGIR